MKKPKEIKECPACDGTNVKLELKNFTHLVSGKGIYKGKQWAYICPDCGIDFTTAESDEISLKTLILKKL